MFYAMFEREGAPPVRGKGRAHPLSSTNYEASFSLIRSGRQAQ